MSLDNIPKKAKLINEIENLHDHLAYEIGKSIYSDPLLIQTISDRLRKCYAKFDRLVHDTRSDDE